MDNFLDDYHSKDLPIDNSDDPDYDIPIENLD